MVPDYFNWYAAGYMVRLGFCYALVLVTAFILVKLTMTLIERKWMQ